MRALAHVPTACICAASVPGGQGIWARARGSQRCGDKIVLLSGPPLKDSFLPTLFEVSLQLCDLSIHSCWPVPGFAVWALSERVGGNILERVSFGPARHQNSTTPVVVFLGEILDWVPLRGVQKYCRKLMPLR